MTCSLVEGCPRPNTSGGGCIKHKFEGGIRVTGMALFAHDRDLGMTQMEKDREQQREARDNKRIDLARVRGMRTPTERRTDNGWEKV